MTPSRTVIVGSALPLLILIGLVGLPPVRNAVGLQQSEPVPLGSNTVPIASANEGVAAGVSRAAAIDEARSLARLRRSIGAGHELAFTGTEVVSVWHLGGSSTRVLDLAQNSDGVRTVNVRNIGDGEDQIAEPGLDNDGLTGLSERALAALAAGHELRTGGDDQVAGRAATVVIAARDGQEVAKLWLDDQTGLLLRQDVLDDAGQPRRMAAFLNLTMSDSGSTSTPVAPRRSATRAIGASGLSVPAARASAENESKAASAGPWSDVISPAELTALRTDGWPCPAALAAGYVLLDARRTSMSSGRSTLHLTYGDGLSAVSVFLQRGELDAAGLAGLSRRKWGDAEVYVRDGWPEVMVWQGGPTVITAVGDAEPSEFQTILSALPRQSNHGTLEALQHRMGSALAWLGS